MNYYRKETILNKLLEKVNITDYKNPLYINFNKRLLNKLNLNGKTLSICGNETDYNIVKYNYDRDCFDDIMLYDKNILKEYMEKRKV